MRRHSGSSLGRYELLSKIATGGMAEVFLARLCGPLGFERRVAIKRILPHLAASPSFSQMFVEEATLAASVSHVNVIQVFELGVDEGELFQVMEYLEGESVASILGCSRERNRPLSIPTAAVLVAQACAGLHAAHELRDPNGRALRLVHRDVSPSNLFVTLDGQVKVLDFGVAKIKNSLLRTETGRVKGKGPYMSPEQAQAKVLDRRSDVFSLGSVLFELCTLERLFQRENALLTLRALCEEPIPALRAVRADAPPELESVLERALARDPRERYPDADAMRRDLMAIVRRLADSEPDELLSDLMRELGPQSEGVAEPLPDTATLPARVGHDSELLDESALASEVPIRATRGLRIGRTVLISGTVTAGLVALLAAQTGSEELPTQDSGNVGPSEPVARAAGLPSTRDKAGATASPLSRPLIPSAERPTEMGARVLPEARAPEASALPPAQRHPSSESRRPSVAALRAASVSPRTPDAPLPPEGENAPATAASARAPRVVDFHRFDAAPGGLPHRVSGAAE